MTNSFMKQAIELAVENIRREGGPFAALVVKDGIVIATGANQVTRSNDPTAHAEIVAIREACRVLGIFSLQAATSTPPANPARCAWEPSSGRARPRLLRGDPRGRHRRRF